jgi:hypothetical protein
MYGIITGHCGVENYAAWQLTFACRASCTAVVAVAVLQVPPLHAVVAGRFTLFFARLVFRQFLATGALHVRCGLLKKHYSSLV